MTIKVSDKGKNFIKKYEGFRNSPYKDGVNTHSVGWGHQLTKNDSIGETITIEQANILFEKDIAEVENKLSSLTDVKQHQFDALASFVFNLGNLPSSIKNNLYDNEKLRNIWLSYCHSAGKVLVGLQKRREAEFNLFTEGVYE